MEISSQRIEMFDRIAESFSWALSHSRVSVESLGEFATLLYLIKHDMLRKVSNSDCKEGNDLFVLQFGPSLAAGDMEKWMQNNIRAIGLMRKTKDPTPEIESILQRYRTTLRQHQSQDALVRTFDLIKEADLKDEEYLPLLLYVEQTISKMSEGKGSDFIFSPASLAQIVAILPNTSTKAIYDPYMGIGTFAVNMPEDIQLFGADLDGRFVDYAMLKFEMAGRRYAFVNTDSLSVNDAPADCIVTFPPLGVTTAQGESHVEHLVQLFLHTEHIKELILVTDEAFLTSRKYQELRKEVTEHNYLDIVFKLPHNYFSATGISVSVLHLSKLREEETYIMFYNFAEDAKKVGRRMEVTGIDSVEGWIKDFRNGVGKFEWEGFANFSDIDIIRGNNYDWSVENYPNETSAAGNVYGGDYKKFVSIVAPFRGEPISETPEHFLNFRQLESPLDKPILTAPKGTIGVEKYMLVKEPVLVVGYSNKCPLYYLEASEDQPAIVSRREIMYLCSDPLVSPLYLAYRYSNMGGIPRCVPDHIFSGAIDANRKINNFLRAQEIGLPTLPAQLARLEEFQREYAKAQLEQANVDEYINALREQYKAEVRSRKHNMRPYLRKMKSANDLALDLLDEATTLEELKIQIKPYLLSMQQNRKELSKIIDTLSVEEKFGEEEWIKVYDGFLLDYASNYSKDIPFVFHLSFEENIYTQDEKHLENAGYVIIARSDLKRMLDCIIDNACTHGFADRPYEEHIIEITCVYDDEMYEIRVSNNGTPLPEGMDINTYGLLGGKAGKHAGTGDGGYQVVSIATHYGGYVELQSTPQDDPNSKVTISVFLPAHNMEDYES